MREEPHIVVCYDRPNHPRLHVKICETNKCEQRGACREYREFLEDLTAFKLEEELEMELAIAAMDNSLEQSVTDFDAQLQKVKDPLSC